MANSPQKRILVLGAGFAGAYAFLNLQKYFGKNPGIKLSLADKNNYFLFTPLLHEVATGGQTPTNITDPLRQMLAGLTDFYQTEIKKIDLKKSSVTTGQGDINYDYLVIALGAATNFFNIPGAAEHALTLKSLPDAVLIKNRIIANFEAVAQTTDAPTQEALLHFVVVGGGPTGVELAAELADFCCNTFGKNYQYKHILGKIKITLIQAGPELLPQFPQPVRQIARQTLQAKGISITLNGKVVRLEKNLVILDNGDELATHAVIWVAGVMPAPINIEPQPLKAKSGRLTVNEYWQLPNCPNVFAIGDMADRAPALAQAAVKEAKAVAANIYRLINNKPLKTFAFRSGGDLISLGRWKAAGQIFGVTISGKFAWWLWRTVYLLKMPSWQKKIKVAVDWTINLFSTRDISEL